MSMNSIGKARFDVNPPPRSGMHECVKGGAVAYGDTDDYHFLDARQCITCINYTKSLDCKRYMVCLQTEELDNYVRWVPSAGKFEDIKIIDKEDLDKEIAKYESEM